MEKKRCGGKKDGEKMKKENYWFASHPHLLPIFAVTEAISLSFAWQEVHQEVMRRGSGKFLPFAFWDLGVLLWDATGI